VLGKLLVSAGDDTEKLVEQVLPFLGRRYRGDLRLEVSRVVRTRFSGGQVHGTRRCVQKVRVGVQLAHVHFYVRTRFSQRSLIASAAASSERILAVFLRRLDGLVRVSLRVLVAGLHRGVLQRAGLLQLGPS